MFFGIAIKGFSVISNSPVVCTKPYIALLILCNRMYAIPCGIYAVLARKKLIFAVVL